jgi:dolichyl-phosphate-mannose-protein mannosyltransferase
MESARALSMRWTRADFLALVCVTLVGGLLRAIRLTSPPFAIGDEGFYAPEGCWYVLADPETCGIDHEVNFEHPPLGKWIIGLGIKLFGYDALGWRILPVIFGTLSIVLCFIVAKKLLHSTAAATVAAGLLAFDFMHFVLSRSSMLDVFLMFFVLATFVCLVFDRDRTLRGDGRAGRWWRYASGAFAGAAVATKWGGAFALLGAAMLAFAWDVSAHQRPGERHPVLRTLKDDGLSLLTAFVIVPAIVYAATFIGRVEGTLFAWPGNENSWLNALIDRQQRAFNYHAHQIFAHRFASEPWSWPLTKRGISFVRQSEGGMIRNVVVAGNPVVWTLSLVALVYVAFKWIRTRRPSRPEGFIVAGFAWAYLPWLLYANAPYVFFTWGRVALFIWYLLPALPFMYLGMAYAAVRMWRRTMGKIAVVATGLFVVASFAFYYPVLAYVPISQQGFDARMFAFDNCRPPKLDLFFFKSKVVDGVTTFERQTAPAVHAVPPEGWCWL